MPTIAESFTVTTSTKAGQRIVIREMTLADAVGVHSCMTDTRFRMPYLTGTPDPKSHPVRPWLRSVDYVLKAIASRASARPLFGARRHWIMAVTDTSDAFLGVALLDAVARFPGSQSRGLLTRMAIEDHKIKNDQQIGDAEWGFFLTPHARGQGIALQAIYALTGALAFMPSWCAPGRHIVHRVWAETGANNTAAIALLSKAGLVESPERSTPAPLSPRFEPDGNPIALLHFTQPHRHTAQNAAAPVKALLDEMKTRGIVRSGWQIS